MQHALLNHSIHLPWRPGTSTCLCLCCIHFTSLPCWCWHKCLCQPTILFSARTWTTSCWFFLTHLCHIFWQIYHRVISTTTINQWPCKTKYEFSCNFGDQTVGVELLQNSVQLWASVLVILTLRFVLLGDLHLLAILYKLKMYILCGGHVSIHLRSHIGTWITGYTGCLQKVWHILIFNNSGNKEDGINSKSLFSPLQAMNMFIAVSAVSIVEKMAAPQERAQTVVWFCETKSVTQTQRNFRTHYQKDPPSSVPSGWLTCMGSVSCAASPPFFLLFTLHTSPFLRGPSAVFLLRVVVFLLWYPPDVSALEFPSVLSA
jgi:hypothetical protein